MPKQVKKPAVKPATPGPSGGVKKRRTKYTIAQYGGRKQAQKRFGTTGRTHEAEHVVGYKVLSPHMKRGLSALARDLENQAPAYQEVYALHRNHIGTGNRGIADASGFNAQSYRDAQRQALEDNSVSNAVQLNQLGYAFDPRFRGVLIAADESYTVMIENMDRITYGKANGSTVSVGMDSIDRAEMHLARQMARTGKWPSESEINAVKKRFNIPFK